jgi:hypothetical protein
MPYKDEEKRKQYAKEYRKKNKDRINENKRKNREENIERYREYDRKYYANNKKKFLRRFKSFEEQERLRQKGRESHIRNRKKRNEYSKNWRLRNLEYIAEYNKKQQQDPKNRDRYRAYWRKALKKKLTDPNKKLRHYIRCRIGDLLKGQIKSSESTLKLLGCSIEECWIHLESKFQPGMTRDNYGKWHVDHIRPCSSFDLTDPEQQKICFHYTNLQPLWAIDNIKKGAKYDKDERDTL